MLTMLFGGKMGKAAKMIYMGGNTYKYICKYYNKQKCTNIINT